MDRLIYFDNNATTPLDPGVLDAMMPYFTTHYANASSLTHRAGRAAAAAIDIAREQTAALIGAAPNEITFTSGATEAINMAIKGMFEHYQSKGKHIISCRTEHKAVLDTLAYLEKKGAEVTYLPVASDGTIDLDALEAAIRPDTVLVALMWANNETGMLHPIADIAERVHNHDALFFCDATQAAGKIAIDVGETGPDLLCLSAHKLYGPKGIGALYIRRRARRIQTGALLHGGGQENKLRAGTLNVPGIVGLGKAADMAGQQFADESLRLAKLRDMLETALTNLPATAVNGRRALRLPHVSNITFKHLRADQIMVAVPDIALASGSACVSGTRDPSHVLMAMGRSAADAHASLRVSLGRFNTEAEVNTAIGQLTTAVAQLRASSPIWQLHEAGLVE
ncbi:cysteine desulfurase family protein [Parapedobacter sp. 10938]|uniref:cysteine desulfurase family protein n=1 Tax=Parapedobacter flavus TaxID=3110225 RepID=UPI002DC06076|nr:cysteine desulfurase family protein [Parapedobacter sp. 10938]MEC3879773.1 cysteine desulfurase family protein [Parapedobacter sp. 10938]